MDNSKLTVTVRNKVPEIRYGDYLVSDNKQLKIVFDLDSEWDAYAHKTARFNLDGWQFDIAFTGDTVTLPLLPAYTGELKVGVYAGDLATTTAVSIPVRDSILAPGDVISLEDAAEMARVAAEAERVDAESARAAAELLRQSAEFTRQFNEDLRIEAEAARASAERTRSGNEQDRQTAESARAAAERARTNAESERAAAETERRQGENARELSEYRRGIAEQARQEAEEARRSAENARASAETARADAEASRASSERARASAEGDRAWNENLRSAAENLRVSAENARSAQESARASAELTREQNEAQRIQNELARIAAEQSREARVDAVIAEFDEYMTQNDVFDLLALTRKYGTRAALRMFCQANAPLIGLDEAVLRFYTAATAFTTETYSSTFYRYTTSPSPIGTKKDANAELVCVPSTNSTAGRDDYADLPLFACFDCNYTIDGSTLEPVIHAINGVYGSFSAAPTDSFVGVLQMTGWVRRMMDDTTKTVEYAAYKKDSGFKPLPEAVRYSDNSVRPFVIHAKYAAGYNSESKLSSVSGVQPVTGRPSVAGGANVSHDGQIARWRAWGNQYGGFGICDQAFLQTMLELKYANLGSINVMAGCRNYDFAYTAAVSETGVKRILLTPEQASEFMVGSSVSLGTSANREEANCYAVCGIVKVSAISSVTVNGTQYGAITFDSDTTFNTAANETYIVTQPWRTGSTDGVRGSDGSPFDNQSGKEPFKLQGIEIMLGMYESAMDTMLHDRGSTKPYDVRVVRRASYAVTDSGAGTNAVTIGTILKSSGSMGARYIKELNWSANDPEAYLLPQAAGAASSTGYCAAFFQTSGVSGSNIKQHTAFGAASIPGESGVACISGIFGRSSCASNLGCRACGTAGNRGVYTESAGVLG